MRPNMLHFTCFAPKAVQPTKMTAPTWQCVVETGRPSNVARTTLAVEANSMQKPRRKLMFVRPAHAAAAVKTGAGVASREARGMQ